jgi:hypothetical protein
MHAGTIVQSTEELRYSPHPPTEHLDRYILESHHKLKMGCKQKINWKKISKGHLHIGFLQSRNHARILPRQLTIAFQHLHLQRKQDVHH